VPSGEQRLAAREPGVVVAAAVVLGQALDVGADGGALDIWIALGEPRDQVARPRRPRDLGSRLLHQLGDRTVV
jgi:hypothetical protein